MINRLTENFAQVSNAVLWNKKLSAKAKGLYAYLCSKPNAWKFSYPSIMRDFNEGEKTIRTGVRELVDEKILLRIPRKNKGKFTGWEWIVNPNEEDMRLGNDPTVKDGKNRNYQKRELPENGSTKNGEENSNTVSSNTVSDTNTVKETSLKGGSEAPFGNVDINKLLEFLRSEVKVQDFTNSQSWQRKYAGHMLNIIDGTKSRPGIGKQEFVRRLRAILAKPGYAFERSNDISYLYEQIKAFRMDTPPKVKPANALSGGKRKTYSLPR